MGEDEGWDGGGGEGIHEGKMKLVGTQDSADVW